MLDLKRLVNWLSGTSDQKIEPPADNADRRRYQRLNLESCEVNFFGGGPFPVSNLSYGGFRADLAGWAGRTGLEKDSVYDCMLVMQGVRFVCQIIIKNLFSTFAGCAFAGLTSAQSSVISDFIKPRIVGCSLREINSAKLKNDSPGLKMRWFQGEDGSQVFLWQTVEGETVKQEFYFFDYFMVWEKSGEGLRTGRTKTDNRRGFGRISPDSVIFFRIPPYRALKLGRTVLECSKLPEEARENILREIAAEEKRLFHRYIIRESGVSFIPDVLPDIKLTVLNISLRGLAVYNAPEARLNCESSLPGSLVIGDKSIHATFKPTYMHANILGGHILLGNSEDQRLFEEFLAPRLLAQYLAEVPSPPERPTYSPKNARCSLYAGLHNTHLLSLIESDGSLYSGRVVFMDRALKFHRNALTEYRCPEGLIFPGDWELESAIVRPLATVGAITVHTCREMIENAEQIADEVKQAWLVVLKSPE